MKFWIGQSVSLVGSQFTLLALPLTAVLTLHASPAQMGLLGAALSAPGLLFGLAAGVWLDRAKRSLSPSGASISTRTVRPCPNCSSTRTQTPWFRTVFA